MSKPLSRREAIVIREDRSTGEIGFCFEKVALGNSPTVFFDGRMAAHDLLEHMNGLSTIGSFEDEMEALGACYYVRGMDSVTIEGLANDLAYMYESYARSPRDLVRCKRLPVKIDYLDDDLSELEVKFEKAWRGNDNIDAERLPDSRRLEYIAAFKRYFLKGYGKAELKYESQGFANSVFKEIERAFDQFTNANGLKHGPEECDMYRRFCLSYKEIRPGRVEARMTETTGDY